jgi:hypothetical protein
MSVLGRLSAISSVIAAHKDEPYVRGRAAQLAGTALLADGLVGLENPVGKNSRLGIFGGLVMLIIGILALGPVGSFAEGFDPYADGTPVVGTVATVTAPSGDGNTCSITYTYEFDGQSYTRAAGYSSSGLCERYVGEPLEVSVSPAAPAAGRLITTGGTLAATWIPRAPWLLILGGAWTVLVRAVQIVVGIRLLLWGRRTVRDTAATGDDASILAELRTAWGGVALPRGLSGLSG